jgi:predicted unusual protein kinase regulating ubiquinone biosynthesis (AarF/ABC1/UbiB family)
MAGTTSLHAARTDTYRRPFRRLLRAYFVTMQVVLSYAIYSLRRRLRGGEAAAQFADRVHRKNAQRVLAAIVDLQGLFIKVGQLISVMANLLPAAFRKELETLQDSVPPRSFEELEIRLREEFHGKSPRQIFAEFDLQPVASASIGQVHVARLHSGEKVAVKIQYPGIEIIVATDLRALKRIFKVAGWLLPDWGWNVIYGEIQGMVLAELDYRQEAEAIATIAGNFAGRKDVLIPRVIAECSTGRVLTTQWMDGVKVSDFAGIAAAGIDRVQAARLCIEAYCKQIFVDGVYHADPHPGNLLLVASVDRTSGPTLVFLDFGATARISPGMRKGIVSFLQGAVTRDVGRIVSAMKEMGFISRHADHEVFDRVIQHFYERFRSQMRFQQFSTGSLSSGLDLRGQIATLLDLRQLDVSLSDLRDAFHVPKEWVLLERTLLLLLGVCTGLAPELNPAEVIQPYVDRFILGERKEWSETILETAREAALSAFALPSELGRFLNLATRGDIEIRVRRFEESAEILHALGQQILWAFLGAVSFCLSVVYEGRGQVVERTAARTVACLLGVFLVVSIIRGRRSRKRKRKHLKPR